MTQRDKCQKLILRMQWLVENLGERKDLVVHQQLDQFFYMQKIEELQMLLSQFDDIKRRLESITSRIHAHYHLCLDHWRKDARWLNAYNANGRPTQC